MKNRRQHLLQIRSLLAFLTVMSGHKVRAESTALNATCPIMTQDEADPDITVRYEGTEIAFCCGPCVKQFKKEPHYYAFLFQAMGSVPQLKTVRVPVEVRLMEQRFCPFSTKRVVGPSSPSVEYQGVKIYFSKPGHLTAWQEEPDKYSREAFVKGLLPQLQGKI